MYKETLNTDLIENVHYNILTEQRIIGMVLFDNSLLEEISHVKKEYFFYEDHKNIFETILLLRNNMSDITSNSVASNIVKVIDITSEDKDIESYLSGLAEIPTQEKISIINVAIALINFWQCRETHNTLVMGLKASTVNTSSFNKKTMFGVIERLTAIHQSVDGVVYSDLSSKVRGAIDRLQSGENANKTLKSGYYEFDEYDACFRKCDLTIIGAYTGHGKTSFALNVAMGLAKNNHPTLFASLELSEGDIVDRMLAISSDIELERITKNSPSNPIFREADFEKLMVMDNSHEQDLNVVYKVGSLTEIIGQYRIENFHRLKSGKKKIECLVIDYIKLLYDCSDKKEKDTAQGISIMCAKLKEFAEKEKISIIALAQLNRESQKVKEGDLPSSWHIADSAGIERSADVMIILNSTKDNPHELLANITKNRKYGVGIIRKFDYNKKTQKISMVRSEYNDFQSKIAGDK